MVKIWLCSWGSQYVDASLTEELLLDASPRMIPGAQQYKLRVYSGPSTSYVRYINAEARRKLTGLIQPAPTSLPTDAAFAAI